MLIKLVHKTLCYMLHVIVEVDNVGHCLNMLVMFYQLVKLSMAKSLPVENLLPQKWGQLSTTFSNALKQPTGELLVAVNHNQLRTMAPETVDPIDWSHPPPSWAVPPEGLVHSINQCTSAESNVQPQHARQPPCLCGHSGYKYTLKIYQLRVKIYSVAVKFCCSICSV